MTPSPAAGAAVTLLCLPLWVASWVLIFVARWMDA